MTTEGSLVAAQRQEEIFRRALARRVVRVKDLALEYGVHEMTIRRDLDQLTEGGRLERIHGGARLSERTSEELSHQLRAGQNREGKEAIAREALRMLQPGNVIALDASTTCLALARMLGGLGVGAIVTSLDAAEALAEAGVPFTLAGGAFHPSSRSFVGTLAERTLERLNPDKAFFSAKGYTPATGFADPQLPEVAVKSALLRGAGAKIALLDHTKFGRPALARIAGTDEIDAIITDQEPEAVYREAFARNDVRLILAQP